MPRFALVLLFLLLSACSRNDDVMAPYAGRWLVINYWATWCKPCREEIAELNHFARAEQSTVQVLGINFDGVTGDELAQQAKQLGIEFTLLEVDPAQQGRWPRPQVLPTTLIVDPDGVLRKTLVGPQTNESLTAALGAEKSNPK